MIEDPWTARKTIKPTEENNIYNPDEIGVEDDDQLDFTQDSDSI